MAFARKSDKRSNFSSKVKINFIRHFPNLKLERLFCWLELFPKKDNRTYYDSIWSLPLSTCLKRSVTRRLLPPKYYAPSHFGKNSFLRGESALFKYSVSSWSFVVFHPWRYPDFEPNDLTIKVGKTLQETKPIQMHSTKYLPHLSVSKKNSKFFFGKNPSIFFQKYAKFLFIREKHTFSVAFHGKVAINWRKNFHVQKREQNLPRLAFNTWTELTDIELKNVPFDWMILFSYC